MTRLCILIALLGPPTEASRPAGLLTVEKAVAEALSSSPDLLDAVDAAATAAAWLSGSRSLFAPQLSPFYQRTTGSENADASTSYGVRLSQQFTFGTRVEGSIQASTQIDGPGYTTAYSVGASQPLLRGADPVVTREPLRAAERLAQTQGRSLTMARRRAVIQTWSAFLNVIAAEELVRISSSRTERAQRLVAASEAKLEAGSVSRLDVLRASQLLSSARSQDNDTRNARDDAHDALGRILGRPPSSRFLLEAPQALPVQAPDEETAVNSALVHREDVQEARDRVRDAEIALRISKSMILPSLDAVAGWNASGSSSSFGGSLSSPGKPTTTFGLRSSADLNIGMAIAQKNQSAIILSAERRHLQLVQDDAIRLVRQSARRLQGARERLNIDAANMEVAQLQLDVATLRFEKGLTDNFNVIDAENLFNSAQISLLSSRNAVLLAELDLLFSAALLLPEDFVPKNDK
jgi:outer membrane protein